VTSERLRILQVNTEDTSGGAALIAWSLFQLYRMQGYGSWLAVEHKHSDDTNVLLVPNHKLYGRWTRFWWNVRSHLKPLDGHVWGAGWLSRRAGGLAQPGKSLDGYCGFEDFRFPGTWRLLQLTPRHPDIIHCHNLHGGYFDLRALPWLSQQIPMILTLHDAWLLSGHCAHSFGCDRWKNGCGHCPDLAIYPAIRRDATDYNWRRKHNIYSKSRLYVATPSQWLMRKVERSMLAAAVVEARVIPNGVDLSIFHPADKEAARAALGIPQDARVLLFTAKAVRQNIWKDYQTVRAAINVVAARLPEQKVLFIALGEDAPAERIGEAEVRFVTYQSDSETVARYYQAADVYVHAARADTFPNTVLEALACGTPVVATAVGGIPEQVEDERTGFLVPAGDVETLAARLVDVLSDDILGQTMGAEAATVARRRFDLRRQADMYLEWYHELVHREVAVPLLREA
jgi:glycosyltransferase involved in cell wall biosynthesis